MDLWGQSIDVTDVPPGDYVLCLTADARKHFVESRDGNNQSWARLTLTTTSVVLEATGRSRCQTQVAYDLALEAPACQPRR